MLSRRAFLTHAGLAAGAGLIGVRQVSTQSRARGLWRLAGDEHAADLVVIGGVFGGCGAALAAARRGLTVVMTEETDWIGGQLTSQAVPLDENAWIERTGGSRTYRALRDGIRDYYRRHYPLTAAAAANLASLALGDPHDRPPV